MIWDQILHIYQKNLLTLSKSKWLIVFFLFFRSNCRAWCLCFHFVFLLFHFLQSRFIFLNFLLKECFSWLNGLKLVMNFKIILLDRLHALPSSLQVLWMIAFASFPIGARINHWVIIWFNLVVWWYFSHYHVILWSKLNIIILNLAVRSIIFHI